MQGENDGRGGLAVVFRRNVDQIRAIQPVNFQSAGMVPRFQHWVGSQKGSSQKERKGHDYTTSLRLAWLSPANAAWRLSWVGILWLLGNTSLAGFWRGFKARKASLACSSLVRTPWQWHTESMRQAAGGPPIQVSQILQRRGHNHEASENRCLLVHGIEADGGRASPCDWCYRSLCQYWQRWVEYRVTSFQPRRIAYHPLSDWRRISIPTDPHEKKCGLDHNCVLRRAIVCSR